MQRPRQCSAIDMLSISAGVHCHVERSETSRRISMILLANSQQGGVEGCARQEHAFVARGCQQSWPTRATKTKQCGAAGPRRPGWRVSQQNDLCDSMEMLQFAVVERPAQS